MDPLKFKNLTVWVLTGTRPERAAQQGKLLGKLTPSERKQLAFTPLSKKNQILIKRAGSRLPGIGKLIGGLYEAFVLERFLRLPKKYRNTLNPFAEASGIPKKRIWLALYQPDLLMVLAASANAKIRNRFLQGLPGCSTVRVFTPEGTRFIRTLDYPAASYWEKNPAVCYHQPTEPGLQNYVSVGSLGLPTSGVSGWNEAGIAFSLHAHFSKKISLKGVPIFFLGDEILEQAKTLDEAIEICRNFKTIGSWALNITSFKENRSVTVELSGGHIFVREPDSKHGISHTNLLQGKSLQKHELHFSGAFFEDCESRMESLEHLADQVVTKPFSWKHSFETIANHIDPTTEKARIFGNTVSVVTTIQTIGFDPIEDCIYVSIRSETPTPHGPYLKLPRDPRKLKTQETPTQLILESNHSESFMKALHLYHQAYVSWQVRDEPLTVPLSFLIQAVDAQPTDPHLLMQRGYFEMMAGQVQEALQCFDHSLKQELSSHLYQVALYFRAACKDLLGQRESAIEDYQTILSFQTIDEKLGKKAKNRLNRPYRTKDCKRIEPDLQFVEPINYP
jgi:hypothetical protein